MKNYILSLDQGTTSSRAIIFDRHGKALATAQKEFTQHYPHAGWVEHNPEEIWWTQIGMAVEALGKAGIESSNISAVGITNQRETTVVWNRKTGKPIYNAIVWQDRRTADFCDRLKDQEGLSQQIVEKTGLVIDSYFSATKIKWILDNVKGARQLANEGKLAFGTIDTWLIWNLTHGKLHITDVTNASRTMLFNIHTLQWDNELLQLFDIPENILPEVRTSSEVYGNTTGLLPGIPIAGIAGDQQAALFGQMCIDPGMVKNTYGTGCFMVMNIGDKPIISKNNLLTTVAWTIGDKTTYALEGSIFIAGAVVQWLRDGLGVIEKSDDIEKLASKVKDSDGIYFVPAFAGMGAPHWNQHARGTLFGITRGTTAANIAHAALDSIAYQTFDVLQAMQNDCGIEICELRVDGGATVNNHLMQFQSNLLQKKVVRPKYTETTALGAAYLAGLAVKYWDSIEELRQHWQIGRTFFPELDLESTSKLIKGWHRAIAASHAWADNNE